MDIQRYLLIAAAAALSFMLLTEWTAFKEQRVADERQDRESALASSGSSALNPEVAPNDAELTALPSFDESALPADDLPDVVLPDAPMAQESLGTPSNQRLIVVSTDVLDVVINLSGGDIIETSLKNFRKELTIRIPRSYYWNRQTTEPTSCNQAWWGPTASTRRREPGSQQTSASSPSPDHRPKRLA